MQLQVKTPRDRTTREEKVSDGLCGASKFVDSEWLPVLEAGSGGGLFPTTMAQSKW